MIIGTFALVFVVALVGAYYMFRVNNAGLQIFAVGETAAPASASPSLPPQPENTQAPIKLTDLTSDEYKTSLALTVEVYVTGAVKNPGVYELFEDKRVADAVSAAGGTTENADLNSINMARYLEDGEHIIIPGKDDIPKDPEPQGLLNLNTATKKELMSLPGIGDVLADNIMAYREANDGFSDINQLKNVPRIGNRLYDRIKDKITVK